MSPQVLLDGGPLHGQVRTIGQPWPRRALNVTTDTGPATYLRDLADVTEPFRFVHQPSSPGVPGGGGSGSRGARGARGPRGATGLPGPAGSDGLDAVTLTWPAPPQLHNPATGQDVRWGYAAEPGAWVAAGGQVLLRYRRLAGSLELYVHVQGGRPAAASSGPVPLLQLREGFRPSSPHAFLGYGNVSGATYATLGQPAVFDLLSDGWLRVLAWPTGAGIDYLYAPNVELPIFDVA